MVLYFAGSSEAETYLPRIKDDPKAGILFTFFDVPVKRFSRLKKEIRIKKQQKEEREQNHGTDCK